MEAIGTLAGGIAHDFNNILGALTGYAEMVKDDLPENTAAYENQAEVLIAANRATKLVQQILAFSREEDTLLVPVDMAAITAETLASLRSLLPRSITLNQEINCNAAVLGDATQIHQVLLNLGTNAIGAMEDHGGLLTITLSQVELNGDIQAGNGKHYQGPHVKLTVSRPPEAECPRR